MNDCIFKVPDFNTKLQPKYDPHKAHINNIEESLKNSDKLIDIHNEYPVIDYDLVIIGAGPQALALLSKLMEQCDDEMEESPENKNFFKISSNGRIRSKYRLLPDHKFLLKDKTIKQRWSRTSMNRKGHLAFLKSVCIIDRNGSWLTQWKHQFERLGISNLRSSLTAHPDPLDVQCMRVYLESHDTREKAVRNIKLDRNKVYHGPFELPKTAHYNTFCEDIINRYNLEEVITKGTVTNVKIINSSVDRSNHHFDITFDNGESNYGTTVTAKYVVFACGPLNIPLYPDFYLQYSDAEREFISKSHFAHSCDIMWAHSDSPIRFNFQNILIIGGGLTAGHLAVQAVNFCKENQDKKRHVTLCTRRKIECSQFDIDISWMGRERTALLASFWSLENYEKRLEVLSRAKKGGSMTPEIIGLLNELTEAGYLSIYEQTNIDYAGFNNRKMEWEVIFNNCEGSFYYDFILCATGTEMDFLSEKMLFKQLCPDIELVGKYPKLTNDLRLKDEMNAFIMGEYAGLHTGPGSLNLLGARASATRIAKTLKREGVGLY